MPLSPLDRAAESLAPAPPTTNFFGSPSPIAALYNARRDAESSAQLADAATRLGRSRWDRAAQRRQLVQWGREDEEHQARKDFEAQRGDFLQQIALIDPTDPDYENAKAKLLGTLPRQAMDDDAVRAIFAAKDRTYSGLVEDQERMKWYEQRQADAAAKALEDMRVEAAAAGLPDEEIAAATSPMALARRIGAWESRQAVDKSLQEMQGDAAKAGATPEQIAAAKDDPVALQRLIGEATRANSASAGSAADRQRWRALEATIMNDDRFPATAPGGAANSAYENLDPTDRVQAEIGMAARMSEGDYVNYPARDRTIKKGDETEVIPGVAITDETRRLRKVVWDEAQKSKQILGIGGESGAPPAEAATQPAPETAAESEIPADAPRRTIAGKTYVQVGGKWYVEE